MWADTIDAISAMCVAGLAVLIIWRYNKPREPAAQIEQVLG